MEDVDWLDGFLQAGGADSIDALGVHAYLGSFAPSADASCQPLCFRQIEDFHAIMDRHAAAQPIYITEFGTLEDAPNDLGQYNWMKLPADARGSYLVDALRMASTEYAWVQGATVFNLDYATMGSIPARSEQFWFSLLDQGKAPRVAFSLMKQARASGQLP
jgi:hypothetical protein